MTVVLEQINRDLRMSADELDLAVKTVTAVHDRLVDRANSAEWKHSLLDYDAMLDDVSAALDMLEEVAQTMRDAADGKLPQPEPRRRRGQEAEGEPDEDDDDDEDDESDEDEDESDESDEDEEDSED
jgi:hypothetical protein